MNTTNTTTGAEISKKLCKLMRSNRVTMCQLADAMGLTLKRVREMRDAGTPPEGCTYADLFWFADWEQGIAEAARRNVECAKQAAAWAARSVAEIFATTDVLFQSRISEIADRAGKETLAVYGLWREYAAAAEASDQSALVSEFAEWYRSKIEALPARVEPIESIHDLAIACGDVIHN